MNCRTAREAMTALMVDDRAPGIDRRQLEEHLGTCDECALPPSLVGTPTKRDSRHPGLGWLLGAVAMLIAAVIAAPFLYFHVVDGKAPAALTLPVSHGSSTGPLDGTWKVAKGSGVDYRIGEILFDQNHTAVGQTTRVTGSMVIAGSTVTAAHVKVDMGSIKSGNAGRDTVYRDHLLDTYSHPDADFTLVRPLELNLIPTNGAIITEQATGSLSLRGVTRAVTFPLQVKRDGAGIAIAGSLPIRFGLWHIPDPSFAITRVANQGTIDLVLAFSRSG
ncbi:MAG: YceI family protein [Actinomycetota bacterium]|nr:YceI family protein [Actinomycetota bacterium]